MVCKVVIALPADTYLHTYEVRTRLLGLSRLDLGQPGFLRLHSIRHCLRVPSNPRSLGFVLRRSLPRQKRGAGRFWCGQRVLRSVEPTAPHLGHVALANGAKKESWHYCRVCYRCSVRTPIPLSSTKPIQSPRRNTKTNLLHLLAPLSQASAGFSTLHES